MESFMCAPVGKAAKEEGTRFGHHIREKHSSPKRRGQRGPEFLRLPALTLLLPSLYSAVGANRVRHFMPRRKSQTTPRSDETNSSASAAPHGILRVGPAGWSYLAKFFDTIEINTSFYHPLRPDRAAQWIDRVAANPRFVFTAKLWQRFTHDTRSTTSGSAAADERAVRAGFDVLRSAKRLGPVLLQFPFSFHRTPETVAYLSAVLKRFADY